MIIPKIIFYLNIAAWLLPPFRQKGCKYFLYFLILALSDPIFTIIDWFYPTDSTTYYVFISTMLLIVLLRKKFLYLLLIFIIILNIYLNNLEIRIFTFVIHFVILLYFLKEFVVIISEESKIIIFNLVLVLYEASIIFKFAASYLAIAGYLYFYITTAFEIFIAVFFTIYNEKNSPVINIQMEPREID
jgi:hypothetical protein